MITLNMEIAFVVESPMPNFVFNFFSGDWPKIVGQSILYAKYRRADKTFINVLKHSQTQLRLFKGDNNGVISWNSTS